MMDAPAATPKPKPDLLLRTRLFFSSYAPLFLILAIRFEDRRLMVACAALGIAGFATTWLLLRNTAARITRGSYEVERVQESGAEVAGYVASYLLPFVAVAQPTARDVAAYIAFLFVAAIVHIRSDSVDVNPTIFFFGYRLFRVTMPSGWTAHMLSRVEIPVGKPVQAVRIRDRLLVLDEHRRLNGRTDHEPPGNR